MFLTEYYVLRSTLINYQQHYRHHLCVYIYLKKKNQSSSMHQFTWWLFLLKIQIQHYYFIESRIQRPTFPWCCSERAERFRLLCNMQPIITGCEDPPSHTLYSSSFHWTGAADSFTCFSNNAIGISNQLAQLHHSVQGYLRD